MGVRDQTPVLDGLLCHESELCIEKHDTDVAGFTDHGLAFTPLVGFCFAARSRRSFAGDKQNINVTGGYLWSSRAKIGRGRFRPFYPLQTVWRTIFVRFPG